MADHAVDLGVDQLLRHGGALLRIAGVVFGQQLELDLLAADRHALGVEFVDRHARAVLVVLAQVGDGAAGRADVADLDDQSSPTRRRRPARAAAATIGFSLICMQIPPVGMNRMDASADARDDTAKGAPCGSVSAAYPGARHGATQSASTAAGSSLATARATTSCRVAAARLRASRISASVARASTGAMIRAGGSRAQVALRSIEPVLLIDAALRRTRLVVATRPRAARPRQAGAGLRGASRTRHELAQARLQRAPDRAAAPADRREPASTRRRRILRLGAARWHGTAVASAPIARAVPGAGVAQRDHLGQRRHAPRRQRRGALMRTDLVVCDRVAAAPRSARQRARPPARVGVVGRDDLDQRARSAQPGRHVGHRG